jgi:hypothetical protein
MPYIQKLEREKFVIEDVNERAFDALGHIGEMCENAGDLNYAITTIVQTYMKEKGEKYQHYNDVIGALEGCKLELYRRHIARYEDIKIAENGDVDVGKNETNEY